MSTQIKLEIVDLGNYQSLQATGAIEQRLTLSGNGTMTFFWFDPLLQEFTTRKPPHNCPFFVGLYTISGGWAIMQGDALPSSADETGAFLIDLDEIDV